MKDDSIPRGLRLVPDSPPDNVTPIPVASHVGLQHAGLNGETAAEPKPQHLFVIAGDDWRMPQLGAHFVLDWILNNEDEEIRHPSRNLHLVVTDNELGTTTAQWWAQFMPNPHMRIEREDGAPGWVDPFTAMLWRVAQMGVRHAIVFAREREHKATAAISVMQAAGIPHTVVRQDDWPR